MICMYNKHNQNSRVYSPIAPQTRTILLELGFAA